MVLDIILLTTVLKVFRVYQINNHMKIRVLLH